ncbi:MAG: sigma factor-like helix-turn-helix DNA-binding protein [Planctomycetota bacterium]
MIRAPAPVALDPNSDEAEATAFVTRHQAGLWRWLRALGCDGASAEEHCQDALLAALHQGLARWPVAEAQRWLQVAARNLFLMDLRARRRRPSARSLGEAEAAWVSLRAEEDGGVAALTALDRCIEVLGERERDLLVRRYRLRQGREDMAQALGIGVAAVKQALRRVRARLRACMQRRLGGTPTREG